MSEENFILSPCPFCGTMATVRYDSPSSDIKPWAHVICTNCGCWQDSIDKWNKRANMSFNTYQNLARSTAVYPNIGNNFIYPTLGLCGESGEVAEKIKKVIRDDSGIISDEKRELLKKELGDILWYISNLATEINLTLNDIAESNVKKLFDRKNRGVLKGSGDNR